MAFYKKLILIWLSFFSTGLEAQIKSLDYFIGQAKKNSPLIFEKKVQNNAMEVELKRLKAFYTQPKMSIDAGLLFAPIISADNNSTRAQFVSAGATDYYGYDLAVSDGGQYQALLSVEQPLTGGKKMGIASRNLAVSREINEAEIKLTIYDIERIVGYQYLRCLQSQNQIDVYSGLINLINRELQIMQELLQNGIYKYSDYRQLRIELKNYQIFIEKSKSGYQQNLLDLNIICGIKDTALVELKDVDFSLKTRVGDSFFIRKYELDSLNLISLQQLSELKYQPQLNLFANNGLNAVYLPGLNRLGFSFGLKFSWVLFDGKQRNYSRQETDILAQDIAFKKQRFITENFIRRAKILNQINSIDKQLRMRYIQKDEYDELIGIYKTELSQGQISAIDFVNALRDIENLKQVIINLRMQKNALINTYNYWNY